MESMLVNEKIFGFDSIRNRTYETKADLIEYHQDKLEELTRNCECPATPLVALMDKSILYKHLNEAREIGLNMCSIIEELNQESSINEYSYQDDLTNQLSVKFNLYQDKYLVIDTPLIFKNTEKYANQKELCMLAREIDCLRKDFENKNNYSLAFKIKAPYWLILVRRIREGHSNNVADTDNIEAKKVSNLISKFLFLSDAPSVKRDATITEFVDSKSEVGTSFIILEESNIIELLNIYCRDKSINVIRNG